MLTELLVGMVMALAVLGATMGALEVFFRQGGRANKQGQAQDSARTAVDRMTRLLRDGVNPSGGPVEASGSYEIVFLAPSASAPLTNNPQGLMHTRFCLDATNTADEKLWMQTAPYNSTLQPTPPATTSCPSTSAAWTASQLLAGNLVNKYTATAKPLFNSTTDASGAVTDVAFDAWVDADAAGGAPASRLQSSVTLRNLNHAPTAVITCAASGNGHVACDASASTDSDGQTLFYAWKMDGATLTGQSGYSLDKSGLSSGSVHTFTVTVSDPAGASSSATSAAVTVP
jgi:hypothetical protein